MRRWIIYTLILLALLGIVPVYAQSNTLGLSDADYMLLRNATAIGAVVKHSFIKFMVTKIRSVDYNHP